MPKPAIYKKVTAALLVFSLMAGCSVKLAPSYDQAIVEGLSKGMPEILELFSSVSSEDATTGNYSSYSNSYNELIGRIEALTHQTRSRPMPSNKLLDKVNEKLEARGLPVLDISEAPSSHALEKVTASLIKMRDTHKKQGLSNTEVKAFKGQVLIYLDQAFTYESFLKRKP